MMLLALGSIALPFAAAAQTAEDHRGNRIENFRQLGRFQARRGRVRACTDDLRWCAELVRGQAAGSWAIVIARRGGLFKGKSRTHRFNLPEELLEDRGLTIWDRIVREADGSVMVGVELIRTTGERSGFFSYQRRLLLLRAEPADGAVPVPVLEAPISGHVEQPACASPELRIDEPGACENRFDLDSLFTLVPLLAPDRPALVMSVTSSTTPGRRTRSDGLRGPIERTEGDDAPDPACTYTRSFYLDAAQGRYVPDAPLPDCRDYLSP
jgi:hypothetical protein